MKLWTQNPEYGEYFDLTTQGYIAFVLIAVLALIALIFLKSHDGKKYSTRQLVFSGASIALAFVLSFVKIFHLPWGGSVTMLSMLFACLPGYFFGPTVGFTAAFAYGILQFVQGGGTWMVSPLQVCMDYIFAFTALGAAGFFANKKRGLITGYLVAVFLRGLFHTIGGYLFWMDSMPSADELSAGLQWVVAVPVLYPIIYNYSYIILEAILTVAILCMKPVENGIAQVRKIANEG